MTPRLPARLRLAAFGIGLREARLDVRRIPPTTADKRAALESAAEAFIRGYLAAVTTADPDETAVRCTSAPPALRGFAFEGGAMGCALLDLAWPFGAARFRRFIAGAARHHVYMAHVGAGWALARCPWGLVGFVRHLDPLLAPLAFDGMGFHAAFFHSRRVVAECRSPLHRRLHADAFDNGIGRAIWFVAGARPDEAATIVARFPAARRGALWSGIALAATYLGGAEPCELAAIVPAARGYEREVAVGAAFAAKARQRAGNMIPATELACAALCGLAGAMLGPLLAVQVGMGENILILAFVVIVIGGIGSIRGAFVGALLVGLVDTMGRALLPLFFYAFFPPMVASNLGPSLSSILIYVLMAGVLFFRPQGLFPARG